ncbi:hypothetical protein TPA0910_03780 [Streptomyces hygroscopicus subsp. sporocinereus]|uniref:Uncharacterized protein n=1 Tax=Streptomyces hygroscopicus TaxID=1912 RepID=A0ABQ3TRI1_STRHY|nr:hypothetical protein TPA0910_03780 [Streptomyces hygroscopicus]
MRGVDLLVAIAYGAPAGPRDHGSHHLADPVLASGVAPADGKGTTSHPLTPSVPWDRSILAGEHVRIPPWLCVDDRFSSSGRRERQLTVRQY